MSTPQSNKGTSTNVAQPIQMKPTDQTISCSIKNIFPEEVGLYNELQERERVLDMIINRKMLDLQEYQQKLNTMEMTSQVGEETLRIFIYNTSENQEWQQQNNGGVPSWTLRIEGKLLNSNSNNNQESGEATDADKYKMSWFLSGLSVELKASDGDSSTPLSIGPVNPPNGTGSNAMLVEWHDDPKIPEQERFAKQFDGMDIKRCGSSIKNGQGNEREITADIVIQPKMYPVQLKIVNEELVKLMGKSETTQSECIKTIFWYAKVNELFDIQTFEQNEKDNKPLKKVITIKSDELLMKIFDIQTISMPQLLELVGTKLLKPIDPIRIKYNINTLSSNTLGETIIDIKVNKSLLIGKKPVNKDVEFIDKLISQEILDKESMSNLFKLDENLKLNIQLLNYSKMKYDFYEQLSKDPVNFLNLVLEKNDEYLSILTGDSLSFGKDGLIDEELVRRSEFYSDEFLKQHVNVLFNSGRL